jgi:hypothetical protein
MKQLKSYFLLFLSLTILASCKEDDDKPDEPDYGIQFFECKINGEPFQAVSIPFQCSGPQFDYYPEPFMEIPQGYAVFSGRDCSTSEAAMIRINGLEQNTGLLLFNEPSFADSIFPLYRYLEADGSIIKMEHLIDGEMMIEEFIPRASGNSPFGTIKGTFEFTVTDELGIDTIDVTEGSFRFDVPQIF